MCPICSKIPQFLFVFMQILFLNFLQFLNDFSGLKTAIQHFQFSSMGGATITAVSRLKKDYQKLIKDPVPYAIAVPLQSNILEWFVKFLNFFKWKN